MIVTHLNSPTPPNLGSRNLILGLDGDLERLPVSIPRTLAGLARFYTEIIGATAPYVAGYKLNLAFFEVFGAPGWHLLEDVLAQLPAARFRIADAKRGDIGNSSMFYARTFFETYAFDAITVAPYMGRDSVEPFLDFEHKCVFLLALTSNPGAADFELLAAPDAPLFETVVKRSLAWPRKGQLGFVAGATRPESLGRIRALAPDAPILIPGIGAQHGDLATVLQTCQQPGATGPLCITVSRSILYASGGTDFAEAAAHEAQRLHRLVTNPNPNR
jgi:orotidine-5'-phosphate decarboxylase